MKATLLYGEPLMIDYTPGSAVNAGDPKVVNGHVRILHDDLDASEAGAISAGRAIYRGVKDNSNIADGDAVYWDADGDPVGGTAGTGAFTTSASGNTFCGQAVAAAGVSAKTVDFLHTDVPSSLTVRSEISRSIADPGNAAAIPVTESGSVQIVTTGAQTRTIAAPTFVGQELLVCMKTDGGDCVITVATGVNQTGNNTITLNDAGDSIRLNAIQNGSNIRWRVVYNDGCTLSTV